MTKSAFSHGYIPDKTTFSDAAEFSDAYSQAKFVFHDTAKMSALSDAQETCAPWHSHSHMAVFCDTAKKSAFSDAAAFSDA